MMASRRTLFLAAPVAAAGLLLGAAPAMPGVPDPASSTIPACVVASPDGAFTCSVTVRDASSNPVAASSVKLDFSTCSFFLPCTFACTNCQANATTRQITKATNAGGVVTFDLRVGGTCPNERVAISADGVVLGTAAFSTLDPNGDQGVTAADLQLVQNALVSGDLSADLDCSGTVTAADVAILNAHMGATCGGVVGPVQRTWGRLKGAYR